MDKSTGAIIAGFTILALILVVAYLMIQKKLAAAKTPVIIPAAPQVQYIAPGAAGSPELNNAQNNANTATNVMALLAGGIKGYLAARNDEQDASNDFNYSGFAGHIYSSGGGSISEAEANAAGGMGRF